MIGFLLNILLCQRYKPYKAKSNNDKIKCKIEINVKGVVSICALPFYLFPFFLFIDEGFFSL